MKKYNIIIDPVAEKQTKETFDYIAAQLGDRQAAYAFLDMIESSLQTLELFPESHPLVEREPWHSMGVRKMTIKSFIVYYRPYIERSAVYVLAIIYGRRDQLRQLNELIF
ncbi:MAG: type II toxin-antitoxin system RelE/ParE family toxin [Bacilli bacterium]|nr:type II toxin-antitoxin system RelE/ParE family toxin [Bacilli bacterium]